MKAFLKGTRLFFKVKNIWIRTGVKVKSEHWNQSRQVIRGPDAKLLNATLVKRQAELNEVLLRLKYENSPITSASIRKYYRVSPRGAPTEASVSSLLLEYRDENKKVLKWGYLRKYKAIADHVEAYKPGILARDFSLQVLQDYIDHLLDLEQELENNTIHDHVRKIRLVMKIAGSRGISVHRDWPNFKFKYVTPKPVWLPADELELLERFIPLPKDQVYKDDFLFRAYTGLRFSDAQQLRPHHFVKQGKDVYIDFSVVKTGLDQNLLLSSKAMAIAERWGFRVPTLYAHKANVAIKQICRAAKIKKNVEKVRYRGNERLTEVLEKWNLITTHVARRTFARTWLDRGGDVVKLMKYMGHSSTEQTLAYAGYETMEVNQELKRLMG